MENQTQSVPDNLIVAGYRQTHDVTIGGFVWQMYTRQRLDRPIIIDPDTLKPCRREVTVEDRIGVRDGIVETFPTVIVKDEKTT